MSQPRNLLPLLPLNVPSFLPQMLVESEDYRMYLLSLGFDWHQHVSAIQISTQIVAPTRNDDLVIFNDSL